MAILEPSWEGNDYESLLVFQETAVFVGVITVNI